MSKPFLLATAVFALLADGASAQAPPPRGWLPPEQSREQLPAKFFGTWCKVQEDEESEKYQRPRRGERCEGAEIFIGVRMLLGAGDPRRCQIFNATGNMNDRYFTVLNCNGEWVRYLLISNDPGVLHILHQTDPEAAPLWSD
jgi:hypothetical protein